MKISHHTSSHQTVHTHVGRIAFVKVAQTLDNRELKAARRGLQMPFGQSLPTSGKLLADVDKSHNYLSRNLARRPTVHCTVTVLPARFDFSPFFAMQCWPSKKPCNSVFK